MIMNDHSFSDLKISCSTSFISELDSNRNFLFLGDREQTPGTASDIYSFGIAALETAALDIQSVAPAAAVAAASITAAATAAAAGSSTSNPAASSASNGNAAGSSG